MSLSNLILCIGSEDTKDLATDTLLLATYNRQVRDFGRYEKLRDEMYEDYICKYCVSPFDTHYNLVKLHEFIGWDDY